jgi:two-component sensor histidine kinase
MPAAALKPTIPYLSSLMAKVLFSTIKRLSAFPVPAIHFLILFCGLCLSPSLQGQEYSYVRYNTKDGLAGSTVYDMCQDKDGFIWFATEAGLSRFDGTHFKNFTTADGLPETEILKLYADHKGRVWIAPFKNTICYYYQGKIYTAANDSLLKTVKINHIITAITGDTEDNIFMSEAGHSSYLLQTRKAKFIPLDIQGRFFYYACPNFLDRKGLIITSKDSTFLLADGQLTPMPMLISRRSYPKGTFHSIDFIDGRAKLIKLRLEANVVHYKFNNKKTQRESILIAANEGAWLVDTLCFDRLEDSFLMGKQVYSTFIDFEKNIWFGTGGEGAFKLVSRNFKTYSFRRNKTSEIFSLGSNGGVILAGAGFNKLYAIAGSTIDSTNFYKPFSGAALQTSSNRLTSIKVTSQGNLLLGFDLFLYKRSASGDLYNYTFPIKSIEEIGKDSLLVGTGRNTIRVREKDLRVLDTIWPYRSTAASYYNDQFYIGTVDGLYRLNNHKTAHYFGDSIPALSYRIACFAKPADGSLWVATFGGGIVCIKGTQVVRHLTMKEGLSSDICRSLFAYKHFLWIGTDKGINKIDLSKPNYPIHRYSMADGLPSNIINTIYVDSNRVYVGSPAGLTSFDEKQVSDYSRCELKVLAISVSGRPQSIQKGYQLGYNDNNLKIEFAGISFKSGGDMLYRYRLKGLKDSWDSTRQNQLEYPSLPSGDYQLELVAINKFRVVSNAIMIPILIETAYWQTWWFKILVVGLAIGLTAILVAWRFSLVRRREREKVSLQQKISDLEQLALRSQMNPHFIFNCLNSIQAFIINNDLETTNQYLTEFAHLIRQTMDSAEKGTISVAQEIKYLTRYIELEKMRFGHSFDYCIVADEEIDKDTTYLPSMILQPYVENSIRHGIRHKLDGKGLIEIKFCRLGDQVVCIVEDNGIGRQHARQFRSKMHVEYQSKGMSLAAERVKALNRQYAESVSIEIIDKADVLQVPTGTRILIYFPNKMLSKLS